MRKIHKGVCKVNKVLFLGEKRARLYGLYNIIVRLRRHRGVGSQQVFLDKERVIAVVENTMGNVCVR